MIGTLLTDPYLALAIVLRAALYVFWTNPLKDGYHIVRDKSFRHSEELYILVTTILEVYLLVWLTSLIGPAGTTYTIPLADVDISMWSVVLGLLLFGRWLLANQRTLYNSDTDARSTLVRLAGFYTSILFGVGFSVAFVIGTHPDTALLRDLFQYHLTMAFYFLSQFQAILGLTIPQLPRAAVDHTVLLFKNNAGLSLGAGVIGLGAGVATAGLLLPLILVMAVNAGVLFGAFTGILIRNSIGIAGGPLEALLAGPVSYLSSMGLLILGHTFHEFMAIMLVGIGACFVGMGLHKGVRRSVRGAWFVVIGITQIGFAAFLEVWINPPFINWAKGYITLEPRLVPIAGTDQYMAGVLGEMIATVGIVVVTTWMIRWVTYQLEAIV
ncbi:hypothetical protein NP511_17880 [Natrinema thermotolerans]|uniref:Uncharacterized protein n=1 Tax=Natrinema thermotolerans TaxID=121872 RepID=A0AAF0T0Q1_9EURY|nr:hypothetical protein [Natrinema thermotolerans]QCC60227.1 hypothetical protein DVR14_16955 [Natrinema thermotolerans]QCC61137.1 hypothetical protein DVR14_21075 [Natrinema thermotolerans]WMT07245.1 hypothetical protein NP511_17880 [Natrinema thermotolerans]